jgi:hypothetical protein
MASQTFVTANYFYWLKLPTYFIFLNLTFLLCFLYSYTLFATTTPTYWTLFTLLTSHDFYVNYSVTEFSTQTLHNLLYSRSRHSPEPDLISIPSAEPDATTSAPALLPSRISGSGLDAASTAPASNIQRAISTPPCFKPSRLELELAYTLADLARHQRCPCNHTPLHRTEENMNQREAWNSALAICSLQQKLECVWPIITYLSLYCNND